ncbi:aldehyde oxidase and xanthine dehydrogenase a/b hammerhead [Emticicia oligotrophica DSM 17448]|uniref:Aldehyde oxidase and xanthine dehydrogenase a/b hammerhead n=1 Tax=Emticicia oligotrophica (strain DSM 17448 / CIP 109782 / MTCC 6937 / GPTSA100-15) TaxID=929562 RepID=A0ABM5N4V0_EMTOG|nr:molybdopterin cofactor-binding domain-containing protein [Emticicia oligotrophica]AFK04470.1 aldehyde oxidase and xanthine dehydrogenase a/b hammerhead [Emticicia oligotrophica DSM 17448]
MSTNNTKKGFSRRKFLQRGAIVLGGSVVASYLGCSPMRRFTAQKVESMDFPAMISSLQPDFWFEVLPDNTISLKSPKIEIGQGVFTGLAMLAAEELDVPYEQIKVEHTITTSGLYDEMNTGGSSSTASLYEPIREVAATMREMLKEAAAKKWGIKASEIKTENGTLISGKNKITYAEIAKENKDWDIPKTPELRPKSAFKVVGKSVKRTDLKAKVMGTAKYTLDSELPEMLYAILLQSPYLEGTIKTLDTKEAEKSQGVVKVVREGELVAVVAKNYYAADTAFKKINVEWNIPNKIQQDDLIKLVTVGNGKEVNIQKEGNAKSIIEDNKTTVFRQEYRTPMAAHAQMEVNAAIAQVEADKATIIAGTQGPKIVIDTVSKALGLSKDKVEAHTPLVGGGFGRKAVKGLYVEAALISKAVGKPVKLYNSRQQEFQNSLYRPNTHHVLQAKIAQNGEIEAITHDQATPDMLKNLMGTDLPVKILGADFISAGHGASFMYNFKNKSVSVWNTDVPIPIGIWRGVGMFPNTFAVESFMNELAHQTKKDPIAFRMSLLQNDDKISVRSKKVLETLIEKSGWKNPKADGTGRGIAIGNDRKTIAAAAIELAIVDGKIVVKKVTQVLDVGVSVNPEGIKQQIEGATMMGIGAALYEEVTVKDGQIEQAYFSQYPMVTLADVPEIQCHILEGDEIPYGVGEPPLAPIAPAIAGAILDLTGKAVRSLPIKLS